MRCMSMRLSLSPRFVVLKATVNRARSRASTTRVYGSDVHCKRALNGDTMVCRLPGNTCRCLLNRYSDFLLFFSCECHVLCDHTTSDRVADPESIALVGGGAEIASVNHGQFRNVVCPQGIVCVSLCTFSRLG